MEDREVGELIDFLLKERNISLKKVAHDTGISEYKLKRSIKGERDLYLSEMFTISNYFSIPSEAFYNLHDGICKENIKIIRYMDFAKFLNLLNTRKLYFSSGEKFEDVFEGKIPNVFFLNMAKEIKDKYLISYEDSKRNTYISCWSLATTESYALWKIFAPDYGVAIKTTTHKLSKLIEHVNGMVFKVQYIDYGDKELKIPLCRNNLIMRNFFSLKSNVYKYEEEVRAIYTSQEPIDINITDLNGFIESIYVSPTSPPWFLGLVKDTVKNRYNLNIDVSLSNISLR